MSSLSRLLARGGKRIDVTIDELRSRVRRRFNIGYGPVHILPYRSYGVKQQVTVMGRVIEQPSDIAPEHDDMWWDNLVNMYRRFNSHEIAGAELRISYGESQIDTVTDAEGYFRAKLPLTPELPFPGWFNVNVELTKPELYGKASITAQAEVLIPPTDASFGVISDLDDTVVLTHATNFLKMARMVFLKNAHARLPFAGVAAFYQALHAGAQGDGANPIFYVSSSAWNIYDLLIDFLELNNIPAGPLLLADYGLDQTSFPFASHDTHKLTQIEQILTTYPNLPFILIGDSGQRDRAIYQKVNEDFPGRILAIYIRDVQWLTLDSGEQPAQIETLPNGVEVVLAPNTAAAANHAASHGYIAAAALPSIGVAAVVDASGPGEVEVILDELASPTTESTPPPESQQSGSKQPGSIQSKSQQSDSRT